MHIGTIMIFGGIPEGVWLIINRKNIRLCDFRPQSKSGITGFFRQQFIQGISDVGHCFMCDLPLYHIICAIRGVTGLWFASTQRWTFHRAPLAIPLLVPQNILHHF